MAWRPTYERLRDVAYEWHGGKSSPLYAFASTGSITAGLLDEIDECLEACTSNPSEREGLLTLRKYVNGK